MVWPIRTSRGSAATQANTGSTVGPALTDADAGSVGDDEPVGRTAAGGLSTAGAAPQPDRTMPAAATTINLVPRNATMDES